MRTAKALLGFPSAVAIAMAALVATGGCLGARKTSTANLLIPEEDTAREQFAIAEGQERDARGVFDAEKRAEELAKALAAYEVVEKRFPDDGKYTPAASVLIAEIRQELGQNDRAIAQFNHALKTYPDDSEVRIASLLGLGKSLDGAGRPDEAQVYYKMLIDQYQESTSPEIRAIVEEARQRYRQIRPRS